MHRGVSALGQLHRDGESVGHDVKMVVTSQRFREVSAGGPTVDQDAITVRHGLGCEFCDGSFLAVVFPLPLRVAHALVTRPTLRIHLVAGNRDRKSTRLNSSHSQISYAVFCLKKKKTIKRH